jgi:IS30 family transposase
LGVHQATIARELRRNIGQRHREAIVSLVERQSKFGRLAKVMHNTAELVAQAMTTRLQSLEVLTITSDNGREFAHHRDQFWLRASSSKRGRWCATRSSGTTHASRAVRESRAP